MDVGLGGRWWTMAQNSSIRLRSKCSNGIHSDAGFMTATAFAGLGIDPRRNWRSRSAPCYRDQTCGGGSMSYSLAASQSLALYPSSWWRSGFNWTSATSTMPKAAIERRTKATPATRLTGSRRQHVAQHGVLFWISSKGRLHKHGVEHSHLQRRAAFRPIYCGMKCGMDKAKIA